MATLRTPTPTVRPMPVPVAVTLSVLVSLVNVATPLLPSGSGNNKVPMSVIGGVVLVGPGIPAVYGLWLLRRWGSMGHITNPAGGVRIAYAAFGPRDATRTVLFLPTWSIIHSRFWKMQIFYFARQRFRVVTFDGRGNGGSDRPPSGYATGNFARDTLAVMDALAIARAALVATSAGSRWGMQIAAEHPDRVTHLALIGPGASLDGAPRRNLDAFLAPPPDFEGENKHNAVYWRLDFPSNPFNICYEIRV